jgi:trans-2,3-dihydro-3-hydroxyanthranilate isomerase
MQLHRLVARHPVDDNVVPVMMARGEDDETGCQTPLDPHHPAPDGPTTVKRSVGGRAGGAVNDPAPVTMVDACLRGGRGGSPTAVLWEASWTETERCRVPELTGASHAVFVSVGDGSGAAPEVSLRFFTAMEELPACGHGTIAALAFLAEHAGRAEYQVTLRAGGRAFAGRATRSAHSTFAEFDPGEVQLREAPLHEHGPVLDALGRESGILAADVCLASIGRPRLLVPMSGRSALAALRPDYGRLRDACDRLGLLGCYVHSVPTADGRLAARMFAPSIGVPEDIANANSTACLAARLARRGMLRVSVDMGDSLDRPATITASATVAASATASARKSGSGVQIRVGGSARVVDTVRLRLRA